MKKALAYIIIYLESIVKTGAGQNRGIDPGLRKEKNHLY